MLSFVRLFQLMLGLLASGAYADVTVTPLTVDVTPRDGRSKVTDFEITVQAVKDSTLQVFVNTLTQTADGKLDFQPVEPGSRESKVVTLEKGVSNLNLKRGETVKIHGTYHLGYDDGNHNYVVILRDIKNTRKKGAPMSMQGHFQYAVTLRLLQNKKSYRTSSRVELVGLERRGHEVILNASVQNTSKRIIDLLGEAVIRDSKSNKLVATVPMGYSHLANRETAKNMIRVFPGNKVVIAGKLDPILPPGEYKATVKVNGFSERYSTSSSAKPLKITQELLADRPLDTESEFLPVEALTDGADAAGVISFRNPNFFPVHLEFPMSKTEGAGNLSFEAPKVVAPGEKFNLRAKATGYTLGKNVDKKTVGNVSVVARNTEGKEVSRQTLPVTLYRPSTLKEVMENLRKQENGGAKAKSSGEKKSGTGNRN